MPSCARVRHNFTLTGLTSSQQVFSFIRHATTADIIVIVNVMESPATVSLESLLLQFDIMSSVGSVLIRSSGNLLYHSSVSNLSHCRILNIMLAGLGPTGNTVGTVVDLRDLRLIGYEALVVKVD